MIDFLILISERTIVIGLAILGALMVTAGSLVARPTRPESPPEHAQANAPEAPDGQTLLSRSLTRVGYAVTMLSIVLFIVAGFVSDLRP